MGLPMPSAAADLLLEDPVVTREASFGYRGIQTDPSHP